MKELLAEWTLHGNTIEDGTKVVPTVYHDVLGPPNNKRAGIQRFIVQIRVERRHTHYIRSVVPLCIPLERGPRRFQSLGWWYRGRRRRMHREREFEFLVIS